MSTLQDLAEIFDVSRMTISRALNGKPGVSDSLRRQILAKADEMGYINSGFRLKTGTAERTVGVCLYDISSSFADDVLQGIDAVAIDHGLKVLFAHAHLSPRREREILTSYKEAGLAGIISVPVFAVENMAFYRELKASGPPIVFLGRQLPDTGIHGIVSDNMQGGFSVGRHLVELGHHNVGFVTGPDVNESHGPVEIQDRLLGINRALQIAGRKPCTIIVTPSRPSRDEDAGYMAVKAFFQDTPLSDSPTALFAVNDSVALGAMAALRECEVDVPKDVSVVGFDDAPASRYINPTLTTVRQDWKLMGEWVMKALLSAEQQGDRSMTTLVPSQLIVRGSTGPCFPLVRDVK